MVEIEERKGAKTEERNKSNIIYHNNIPFCVIHFFYLKERKFVPYSLFSHMLKGHLSLHPFFLRSSLFLSSFLLPSACCCFLLSALHFFLFCDCYFISSYVYHLNVDWNADAPTATLWDIEPKNQNRMKMCIKQSN